MKTEKATKTIMQSGDSLVISVTKEVKRLGLGRGDEVDVTLSPALEDDILFFSQAMDNAIMSFDLKTNDRTGDVYARSATVDTIYNAVSVCAGPNLVVGKDDNGTWCSIELFTVNNDPLMSWVFAITDHD